MQPANEAKCRRKMPGTLLLTPSEMAFGRFEKRFLFVEKEDYFRSRWPHDTLGSISPMTHFRQRWLWFFLPSLATAFATGFWMGSLRMTPPAHPGANPPVETLDQSPPAGLLKTGAATERMEALSLVGLPPAEIWQVLGRLTDSKLRAAAIRECLARLPVEQWQDWIDAFTAEMEKPNHKADLEKQALLIGTINDMMAAVASLDPEGFIAAVQPHRKHSYYSGAKTRLQAVMAWARQNPAAAKAFLQQQLASETSMEGFESGTIGQVAALLVRQGDPEVFDWTMTLPEQARVEAVSDALSEQALTRPRDAAERLVALQELSGLNVDRHAEDIAGAWVRQDPPAALAWALGQTGEIRTWTLDRVVRDWAKRDFDAALAATATLPHEISATGLSAIIHELPPERYGELAQWMERHSSADVRAAVGHDFMHKWTRRDPEAASAWMARLPEGSIRDSAIRGFVGGWAGHNDPEAALLWSATITDPTRRIQTIGDIIHQLGDRAPAEVRPWLDTNTTLTEPERAAILARIGTLNPGR